MYDPLLPLRHRAFVGEICQESQGASRVGRGSGSVPCMGGDWTAKARAASRSPCGSCTCRFLSEFWKFFVVCGVSWGFICCFWGFLVVYLLFLGFLEYGVWVMGLLGGR